MEEKENTHHTNPRQLNTGFYVKLQKHEREMSVLPTGTKALQQNILPRIQGSRLLCFSPKKITWILQRDCATASNRILNPHQNTTQKEKAKPMLMCQVATGTSFPLFWHDNPKDFLNFINPGWWYDLSSIHPQFSKKQKTSCVKQIVTKRSCKCRMCEKVFQKWHQTSEQYLVGLTC